MYSGQVILACSGDEKPYRCQLPLHQHARLQQLWTTKGGAVQRISVSLASNRGLTYLLSSYYVSATALGAGDRAIKTEKDPEVFYRAWNLMRVQRELASEQANSIAYFQSCLLWLSPWTRASLSV